MPWVQKGTMTKLAFLALTLMVSLALVACQTQSDEEIAEGLRDIPSAFQVTSVQLFSDYQDNQGEADKKYKGQVITITGAATEIGVDVFGNPFVMLAGGEFRGVRCFFSVQEVPGLASLPVGQTVTVKGRVEGKVTNVIVRGCVFP